MGNIIALNPVQEPKPLEKRISSFASRPAKTDGGILGLLDNAKPGAQELLEAIGNRLAARFRFRDVVRMQKFPNYSKHITDDEAAQLSKCTAVVTAIGD